MTRVGRSVVFCVVIAAACGGKGGSDGGSLAPKGFGDASGSSGGPVGGSAGRGGSTGGGTGGSTGGTSGSTGGTGGSTAGTGGSAGRGGTTGGAGGTTVTDGGQRPADAAAGAAGAGGTQPLGALCANTGNCSQAMGAAICCLSTSGNACTLADKCPSSPGYVPCASQKDCDLRAGGGKVCCDEGGMRFCTKPSACGGKTLP
jgi:hypothetical protein